MMRLTKKQWSIINVAFKPYKLSTRYLNVHLTRILYRHLKFFATCRHIIDLSKPRVQRRSYFVSLQFNKLFKKGGFIRNRPRTQTTTWPFHGILFLTRFGRDEKRRIRKRRRSRQVSNKAAASKQLPSTSVATSEQSPSTSTAAPEQWPSISTAVSEQSSSTIASTPEQLTHTSAAALDRLPIINTQTMPHVDRIELIRITPDYVTKNAIDGIECQVSDASSSTFADITCSSFTNNRYKELCEAERENNSDDNAQELPALLNEDSQTRNSETSTETPTTSDQQSLSPIDELTAEPVVNVNAKLREQLNLLKLGKCEKKLFTPKTTAPITRSSTISLSKRPSFGERRCAEKNDVSNASALNVQTIENSLKAKEYCARSESMAKPMAIGGMINSLFNKLQTMNKQLPTETGVAAQPSFIVANNKINNMPKSITTNSHRSNESTEANNESIQIDKKGGQKSDIIDTTPVELLGFDIKNRAVDVSALLPTPKVMTQSSKAAFISEDLDTFMKENSLDSTRVIAPKEVRPNDEALVTNDSAPPALAVPQRPMSLQRPRTLAEKRMYLQQQNDLNVLIVENESTVYHELKKRMRMGDRYNTARSRSIQEADVPFRRDCWRAACWISTSNERYYFQSIRYGDQEIKLAGSYGNHDTKLAYTLPNLEGRSFSQRFSSTINRNDCMASCKPIPSTININNVDTFLKKRNNADNVLATIKPNNDVTQTKTIDIPLKYRMNMFARPTLTPGPRSRKLKAKFCRSPSFDLDYGPLEIMPLPRVQLETWPHIGVPLPDNIRPLLKMVWSDSNVITADRALFATSVLRQPTYSDEKHKLARSKAQSIVFDIPYENNEKCIIIRRRRRKSLQEPQLVDRMADFYVDSKPLSFAQRIDATDDIEVDCSNILTEMIDTVATSMNETQFEIDDPDLDYVGRLTPHVSGEKRKRPNKPNKSAVKPDDPAKTKLLNELKRLNVTVINTLNESSNPEKPVDDCQKPYCKLGCICDSINNGKYVQTHCQLIGCMFGCICSGTAFDEAFGLKNDINFLRAQADARLAKEEKEFRSTIVVSDTDMFVLPNSSTATKRSSRKPKRFTSDNTVTSDPEMEAIFRVKRKGYDSKKTNAPSTKRKPSDLPAEFLANVQHVSIQLDRLPDCDIEPWCMIHQLYKCHCKGKSQKGHPFTITIKKNKSDTHGGWEVVSARKRQYTFEEDLKAANASKCLSNTVDVEPVAKVRKPSTVIDSLMNEPHRLAARVKPINLARLKRRSPYEFRTLRNTCTFAEKPFSDLLRERIEACRNYNKAQNILMKTSNAQQNLLRDSSHKASSSVLSTLDKSVTSKDYRMLSVATAKGSASPPHSTASTTTKSDSVSIDPSPSPRLNEAKSIQRLNTVISNTMQRLTSNQRQNKIMINPTPNKMSFISWDRLLVAFKAQQLFVWDVRMDDNKRALIMTDSFQRPKNSRFSHVTNITYADTSQLPLLAKMLQSDYQNEKTKYLAMVLIRLTSYWRIIGAVHSNLNYMENELVAKPTPEKNPLLSQKINKLHHLLTSNSPSPEAITPMQSTSSRDDIMATYGIDLIDEASIGGTVHGDNRNAGEMPSTSTDINKNMNSYDADDNHGNYEIESDTSDQDTIDKSIDISIEHPSQPIAADFENDQLRLKLPIKVEPTQRVLMIRLGDDFTHIWFPTWRKILRRERVLLSLANAMEKQTPVDLTPPSQSLKVVLTHKYDRCLFIGPYNQHDKQNVGLFMQYSGQMIQSQIFARDHPDPNRQKSKASWIYPNSSTLKASQKTKPSGSEFITSDFQLPITKSTDAIAGPSNIAHSSLGAHTPSITPPSDDFISYDSLPLKISSVTYGDGVALLTDGPSDIPSKNMGNELIIPADESDVFYEDNAQSPHPHSTVNNGSYDTAKPLLIDMPSEQCDGYIYCPTNAQLGFAIAKWTTKQTIILHLDNVEEVMCSNVPTRDHESIRSPDLDAFMNEYLRTRFYAVYPNHLVLDWTFVYTEPNREPQDMPSLLEPRPLAIVFKDKIISIDEDYRSLPNITTGDIYVTDIFKLASHIMPSDQVKSMTIAEILRKARSLDVDLMNRRRKLEKSKSYFERCLSKIQKPSTTSSRNDTQT